MTSSIKVPDTYGYVILSCAVLPTMTSLLMGGAIKKAREKFNIQYPNLYATPGYHKKADEFNRVQRGAQNMLETMSSFTVLSLIGGLKHPIFMTVGGVCYSLGSWLFLKGYADTNLDVKMARYKKGGGLKFVGIFGSIFCAISMSGSLVGWW